jgi:alkanesulfonate monooxygenase SsuD/methylene tetrahydromethanopterin reductase-like flavin-dependent oxidoreductase (luciferase family)
MQFGIFTVGDVTPDPTNGRVPTEHERIKAMVAIAKKAEEVGLDVFATGEHHNEPFVPSSPTTLLGYIAAQTSTLLLSTSTTLITTNDPVKIAEDYAMLQHLADGHRELRAAAQAVARAGRRLEGQVPHPAAVVHLDAAPARRRAAVRLARLDPQPGDRRAGRVLR